MKILHIASWYQPIGGAEKMLFQMLKGLENRNLWPIGEAMHDAKKGESVMFKLHFPPVFVENVIVTQKASGQLVDHRKKYFIDGLQYDFSDCQPLRALIRNVRIMRELLKIIRAENPDIIHNHNVLNPFVNRALRKSGKPVVFHVHDPRLFCFTYWKLKKHPTHQETYLALSGWDIEDRPICNDPIGKSCLKCIGRNVETRKLWAFLYNWQIVRKSKFAFIIPAKFQSKMLFENGFGKKLKPGIKTAEIYHLPNFTEVADPYVQVAKRRVDTVLFVGRASYEKGIMFLLEALNRIRKIRWRLILCTSGPQLGEVKERIRELKLIRRVKIISTHSPRRLKRLYQQATVCVMPSVWHETFGLVGIEAMANKCPQVAFDVGGISEWLWWDGSSATDSRFSGYRIESKNIQSLADTINFMLNNDSIIVREMQETGYNLAREKFSASVYIPNLITLYEDVIYEHNA